MHKKTHFLTQSALIAALYVVLTLVAAMLGLASGTIQIRLSEALTVLPALTPAAIPGVFVGCILGNLLSGGLPWDVVFGSLASLIGVLGTYLLRGKSKWLYPIPTILSNALIIPAVLIHVYGIEDAYWVLVLTVGIGEILSAGVLGILLYTAVSKTKLFR